MLLLNCKEPSILKQSVTWLLEYISNNTSYSAIQSQLCLFADHGTNPTTAGMEFATRQAILLCFEDSGSATCIIKPVPCPTEIESHIRSGCIILTICLRLENSAWDELCYNLGSRLRKLLAASNDSLWRTGLIYTRVHNSVAILYNAQVVLDVPLRLGSPDNCQILCVKPLAVSANADVKFSVKGLNLFLSSARLLCALEGKYLVEE
ncbi:hypothetical protein KIW84_056610 [Lathyrus oleraceus]|uniref:Uncharacterized protein n=1 Tax=Pisum sativum TaxID=3888 RepID=A0A9D5AMU0_PEA|nr:hypothetical protein KIW84_056610 [Pisum sativum]